MPSSLPTTPPKAPKVKAPAGESGGRPKWIIPAAIVGGIAALVVVVAVALAMGGGGGEEPQPTPERRMPRKAAPAVALSSQGMALKVPAGWSDSGDAPQVPGFAEGAISAGGPKGGAVVFGKADDTAANSTLLAGDLRQAAGELPEKTPVDIAGGAQAATLRGAADRRRQQGDGLRRADRRRRGDARLHGRRGDVRLDRGLAGDHRGQGVPGRPERRLPGRRRGHPGQARQGREVGRVAAEVGQEAHRPGGRDGEAGERVHRAPPARSASSRSARPTRRSTPTWPSPSRTSAPRTRRRRPRPRPRTAPATSVRAPLPSPPARTSTPRSTGSPPPGTS